MRHHVTTLLGTAALLLAAGCAAPLPATVTSSSGAATLPPHVAAPPQNGPPATGRLDPSAPPSTAAAPTGGSPAVIAGWSVVHSTQRAALYDVPPDWTVNSEDTIVGFETKNGQLLVAASGSASVGANACGPSSSLATSVVKHSTSDDLATASRLEAQQWAGAAFLDAADHRPTLRTGSPETITTATGKTAVIVKVTATAASPTGDCGARGAAWAVSATGFTGRLGPTAILIVVAGTDFPSAVPEDQIRRILTTLRPDG